MTKQSSPTNLKLDTGKGIYDGSGKTRAGNISSTRTQIRGGGFIISNGCNFIVSLSSTTIHDEPVFITDEGNVTVSEIYNIPKKIGSHQLYGEFAVYSDGTTRYSVFCAKCDTACSKQRTEALGKENFAPVAKYIRGKFLTESCV